MSDYNYDEHIIVSRKTKLSRLGLDENGIWPHEKKPITKTEQLSIVTGKHSSYVGIILTVVM